MWFCWYIARRDCIVAAAWTILLYNTMRRNNWDIVFDRWILYNERWSITILLAKYSLSSDQTTANWPAYREYRLWIFNNMHFKIVLRWCFDCLWCFWHIIIFTHIRKFSNKWFQLFRGLRFDFIDFVGVSRLL